MLKKIIISLLLIHLSIAFCLKAEEISLNSWQIHTTMNNTLCATTDIENKIWIGAMGGIAVYNDANDNNPILLNIGNKLLSSAVNAMISINDGYIIAGTMDGVLEIIDIKSFNCEHITAIRDYGGFANACINDFYLLKDNKTLLIAGNFGLAEFDIEKKIFVGSIFTIGDYSKNTPVNNIIFVDDTIYVSTPTGIAWTTLDKPLTVPYSWNTLTYGGSLNYNNAKIVYYNGDIFVNLNKSIYRLKDNDTSFAHYVEYWGNNVLFTDIDVYNGNLVVSDDYQVRIIKDINNPANEVSVVQNWDTKNNGFVVLNNDDADTKMVLLFKLFGCAFVDLSFDTLIKTPNTPFSNNFYGLSLDKDGILYAVSDNSQKFGTFGPFMSFDGKQWTNYHSKLSNFLDDANFVSVSVSPDNKVYYSSWGRGVYIKDKDKDNFVRYDESNSALRGVSNDGGYVICGQTAFDSKGNAWVVNDGESTVGPMVVMFDKNNESYGFNNIMESQGSARWVFNIAIDANDTKWIGGQNGRSYGLYYFNERNTIEDKSDDILGNITTSKYSNILSNNFHSCVYDKYTGTIWLGSSAGVSVINNPTSALSSSPNFIVIKNKLLEGQHVNDIFIDATGNKWIATQNGLWIISVDGSELLAHFTTANTPLLNNDVQAITINPNNGLVYIGTSNGLFIAQGNILMPQNDYAIKTFPQPYNLRKHKEVIIEGLTTESDIRIVTSAGVLIRRLITSSKRAIWDGKDSDGNNVKAGIYLVLSNSQISNSGGAAKIVVIDY